MLFLIVLFSLLLTFLPANNTQKWGQNGHRVTGDIAAQYLNDNARKAVSRILGNESIAIASTWMDEIRSDSRYDHTHDWHWVTIPGDMTYEETPKNPNGDIIQTLRRLINELKKGQLNLQEEKEKLKMLIHLVGDLHQPMHVGTGKDRGGNDVRVEWFCEPSNLHRVWDTGMIDATKLSYTEFSKAINHPTKKQFSKWQNGKILDWAYEARELRDKIYDLPKDRQLGYRYMYLHKDLLDRQLLKAGVRLAYVLNQIYG